MRKITIIEIFQLFKVLENQMSKLAHLKFNDPAPDLELLNIEGQPVNLSSLWKKKIIILEKKLYGDSKPMARCHFPIGSLASLKINTEW